MQIKKQRPFMIVVAGSSASGKTTICEELRERLGKENCVLISSDFYYKDISHLSQEDINSTNYDHPESLDFPLLRQHMQCLKEGKSIEMPQYSPITHAREATITVHPKPYILLEGILVLHDEVRNLFDYRIYVDVNPEVAFERRLKRDVKERNLTEEQVRMQYKETVWPMFRQYVEPSRQFAHLVIENSGNDRVFDLDNLVKRLELAKKWGVPKGIQSFTLFGKSKSKAEEKLYAIGDSVEEPILNIASKFILKIASKI